MKVYIGTDHRGVETQNKIVNYLKDLGIDINISKLKHNDNDDYPDFAFDVCKRVIANKNSLGILICGTGIGMSIAANKVKGIRAARCVNTDDAFFARNHNDSNVLCISSNNDINNIYEIEEVSDGIANQSSQIKIINTGTKKVNNYSINSIAKSTSSAGDNIAINLGTDIYFINTKGWLKKKYSANEEIRNIIVSDRIAAIVFRDKIEILVL